MQISEVMMLLGGLGLFLYGMKLMGDGLNKAAGEKMRTILHLFSSNRFVAVLAGALVTAVIIMMIGFVLFQIIPEPMLMMFVDRTDAAAMQEMLEIGVPALKTISFSFVGAAFGIINSTMFQATARGMNSLVVSVCRQLVIILPAAWILGRVYGLSALWYAFPIAEIASFLISYLLLWREYKTELKYLDAGQEEVKA